MLRRLRTNVHVSPKKIFEPNFKMSGAGPLGFKLYLADAANVNV